MKKSNPLITELATANLKVALLQDTLDKMTVEKWDNEEKLKDAVLQIASLQIHLEGARASLTRVQNSAMQDIQNEHRMYAEQVKEVERVTNNYKHAQQTIAQLNTTIALAQKEMENLRKTRVSEEHLARKLILFADENSRLKGEMQTLRLQEREAMEIINKHQDPAEIQQYKAQVNRLLEERATYDCQAEKLQKEPCGQCLKCQHEQTKKILAQTTENLRAEVAKNKDTVDPVVYKATERLLKTYKEIKDIEEGALYKIANSLQFWKSYDIARGALHDAKVRFNLDAFCQKEIERCSK